MVYQDLSVSFGVGVTAILGPNGAGKTTFLEGLLEPGRAQRGTIRLDGDVVPDQVSQSVFASQIGYMPQDWNFFAGFTVQQTVEYGAWLKGIRSRDLTKAAAAAVSRVDLAERSQSKVRTLSGGMRQRVGLAEALVANPRVLLLDEPTVGLDPAQRTLFRNSIRDGASDRAVVLSTHLTDDVEAIADRVIVINDGEVEFDGTPAQLAAEAAADGTEGAATSLEAGYLTVIGHTVRNGKR